MEQQQIPSKKLGRLFSLLYRVSALEKKAGSSTEVYIQKNLPPSFCCRWSLMVLVLTVVSNSSKLSLQHFVVIRFLFLKNMGHSRVLQKRMGSSKTPLLYFGPQDSGQVQPYKCVIQFEAIKPLMNQHLIFQTIAEFSTLL